VDPSTRADKQRRHSLRILKTTNELANSANSCRFGSGRPGSNRRRPAWEAGILPLNYARETPKYTQFSDIFKPESSIAFPKNLTRRHPEHQFISSVCVFVLAGRLCGGSCFLRPQSNPSATLRVSALFYGHPATPPFHHSITPPFHHFIIPPFHDSTTLLFRYSPLPIPTNHFLTYLSPGRLISERWSRSPTLTPSPVCNMHPTNHRSISPSSKKRGGWLCLESI
jgi:hypothetical protein